MQQGRDAAVRTVKQERGIKREHSRERSRTYTDDTDGDDISFVSVKRRRETYPTVVNENGVEEVDLT
jgi:hypothetical protein